MDREKELEQTLNKLISQTKQALDEGRIYSQDFRENLNDARKAIERESTDSRTYSNNTQEFHVLQQ